MAGAPLSVQTKCRKHFLNCYNFSGRVRGTYSKHPCTARGSTRQGLLAMNQLHVGLKRNVKPRSKPCLFIHDEVPDIAQTAIFDPRKHSLDIFKDMTARRARELSELLYAAVPEGANTLTVRNGKRALAPLLRDARRFDTIKTESEEVRAMLDDLLFIPELRNALCGTRNVFALKKHTVILARLDRAELGDFACLVLGFLLIQLYKGQIVIPDLGFYGRDAHIQLVREQRLIAGVNALSELPLQLRNAVVLMKDKYAAGALSDDAETLAKYAGLIPHTNEYNDFIQHSIA